MLVTTERRREFEELYSQFIDEYLSSETGRQHRRVYVETSRQGRENYYKVKEAKERGEDITDPVLLKLMPHRNTSHTRQTGAWVFVAPAIIRDVKSWFENSGWTAHENWPQVSEAIFRLVETAVERPEEFEDACRRFNASPLSNGFQSGFITPILSCIRGEWYSLANSKSLKLLSWLIGHKVSGRIEHYPEVNRLLRSTIDSLEDIIDPSIVDGLSRYQMYQIFCHWLITIQKYFKKEKEDDDDKVETDKEGFVAEGPAEYGTSDSRKLSRHQVEEIMLEIFPQEQQRKAVLQRMAQDILLAADEGTSAWFLSYRNQRKRFRLTAGRYAVSECSPGFYRIHIPESSLPSDSITFITTNGGAVDYWDSKSQQSRITNLSLPPELLDYYDQALASLHHKYIRMAASTFKESPWRKHHQPEAVNWIAGQTGRELPQPDYAVKASSDTSGRGYYWLNCNPAQWDVMTLPQGAEKSYTSYSERGGKRRIYAYMEALKAGDLLIGYETTPGKRVRSLLQITKGLHTEENVEKFTFRKLEDTAEGPTWEEMQEMEELSGCEPLHQNQGSLFRLTPEEFHLIADASGFASVSYRERIPVEIPELSSFIRKDLQDERTRRIISDRMKAEEPARRLMEERIGSMTPDDIGKFLDLVCTTEFRDDGTPVSNRFGMAMRGQLKNRLMNNPDHFNKWIEPLWRLPDSEVLHHLQLLWDAGELSGAGSSLPSVVLYLRDPERYGIWVSFMQKALEAVGFDSPGKFRSATAYAAFNNQLHRFREIYSIPPSGLDLVLWHIDTQYHQRPQSGNEPITIEGLVEKTGFSAQLLSQWISGLERKGQAILYGPPGTGKTFAANAVADYLVSQGNGEKEIVQFHPAYNYEDFIQGIRPETNEEGTMVTYPVRAGHFLEFCRKAEEHGDDPCVLIIDEINRANLARVFGELMYLLEYRKQSIRLAGSTEPFSIPENVYIIGTMNTADRSIALVDHALRRRFAFIPLHPNFDVLRSYHRRMKTGFDPEPLIEELRRVNEGINDPHYELGISYFLQRTSADELESIWRMEIEPYLEEYFFDQPQKMKAFRWERIAGRMGMENEKFAESNRPVQSNGVEVMNDGEMEAE